MQEGVHAVGDPVSHLQAAVQPASFENNVGSHGHVRIRTAAVPEQIPDQRVDSLSSVRVRDGEVHVARLRHVPQVASALQAILCLPHVPTGPEKKKKTRAAKYR